MAAFNGYTATVSLLLKEGADPHAKDSVHTIHSNLAYTTNIPSLDDETIFLNFACLHAFCILKDGMTPLHKAAWEGHTKIVELLLKKGADRSVTDNVRSRRVVYVVLQEEEEVVAQIVLF